MEIRWLHERGVIANYSDYCALPFPVLEHARLLMVAEPVGGD